ncbi:hypothetical protein CEXT_81261 [Caerostris extrusa]|uniref:Uncharacterized protein n=1 Tax=Caerostris extrusa TaxID=172846 RepID=A0AAV4VP62_CAEEX|nr:hypothetical protein CEXT_81261 [Caerostris extrusa]
MSTCSPHGLGGCKCGNLTYCQESHYAISLITKLEISAQQKVPEEKDLYIGTIFPINDTGGRLGGQGCLPAALKTLKDVNAEPDLLP